MSGIPNELVVTTEYVLGGADILIEAKEDGTFATTAASLASTGAHSRAAPLSARLGVVLFVLNDNFNRHGKLRPWSRQTVEEGVVVPDDGSLGE